MTNCLTRFAYAIVIEPQDMDIQQGQQLVLVYTMGETGYPPA